MTDGSAPPGPGPDDPGLADPGLDDPGLADPGLDDPGLDDPGLDEAVRAMGHPGRRAMLASARDAERTAGELGELAGLSPSAASQHLKVLREAGLMLVRVDARRRLYRVDLARLGQVRAVLDAVWADRLEALARVAEQDEADDRRTGRDPGSQAG